MPAFNPVRTICRKRDGHVLSDEEIAALVSGFVEGTVSDAQMAAWAMAVYFRGMTPQETAALTQAMLDSGARLSWTAADRPLVDKHSTGGIGDKTSLVLAPLLAACGVRVPMISGRGLGPTGGTLDKLEAIPGFRTDLSLQEIRRQVRDVGCVITGATEDLVPADRRLYALRDVTGTVPSIPLITASIMSKKLAEGLDALVLDVKHGTGAFMKRLPDARKLAESLVRVGTACGVRTTALITDMNQPLGEMVGNATEVIEAVEVLRDRKHGPVRTLCEALAVSALRRIHRESPPEELQATVCAALDRGDAYEYFCRMVRAQGGDPTARLPLAEPRDVNADRSGCILGIDAEQIGYALIEAGGGRKHQGQPIDHAVGFRMHVEIGDTVRAGEPLATAYLRPPTADTVIRMVRDAIAIGEGTVFRPPLIAGHFDG
ncbi:MAG: thymidine phosphorylase [Planctomycetota bacterium]|nr:MAG: thymidine phosphorylase [Planctomycetota bacterium]